MSPKELIARRVAQEVEAGYLVNLGIGLPTMVAKYIDAKDTVFFQSENGIIGVGGFPEGMENPSLTDAGGGFIGVLPGAVAFDSAYSFGLIRGGHLDMTVLGGLQVDQSGRLANWIVPGSLVPGMGGAMDLVVGAKKVVIAMTHTAKGQCKIVKELTLPKTSERRVDLIVTELAVLKPTDQGIQLAELAPGISVDDVVKSTEAELLVAESTPVMDLA